MTVVRAVLTLVALTTALLLAGGPAAIAAPTPNVAVMGLPEPPPDPDPAPDVPQPEPNAGGTTQIGSVSEVAEGLGGGLPSASARRPSSVGRFASPAVKSAAVWDAHGRPDRLIIVRSSGIDSVLGGRLLRHIKRPVSVTTLRGLASAVPSTWLSIDGTTARLSATVVLSAGVTLDVAAPVTRLLLVGGPAAPAAASMFTGSGALAMRGVEVVSADPVTGVPVPAGPGRPYILASGDGTLDVADATVSDLGATIGAQTFAGLVFDPASRGSVVRSVVTRNTVGIRLQQSGNVLLQDVTVSQSATDGLVMSGDSGSVLRDLVAKDNGKNGVIVSGRSSPRPISGITTYGNHEFGLVIDGQTKPQVSAVTMTNDGAGGMQIIHSTDVSVTDLTATNEPVGVYTHVSSARVALERLHITGGGRGVVAEKTTNDLTLTDSTVGDTELGISLGGHRMRLTDDALVNAVTGVVVERGAADVTFERLAISGGENGLIANPGTSGVVVRDLSAEGVSNTAVRALSPGEQILGGHIEGAVTGIDVQAPSTLTGITVTGADTGVRVRTPLDVRADQVDVTAISVGINVTDGTPFALTDSRVHALESIRGTATEHGANDLSLPALSVLGAIGVPLVVLAFLLETIVAVRQWRARRRRRAAENAAASSAENTTEAPDQSPSGARPDPVSAH